MTSTDLVRPDVMIERYMGEFAQVLPTHIKPATFVRIAVGALRRDANLMQAATKDPNSLMKALMEAARLGLEPGTDEYYLTPKGGSVLGIVGYKGEIEMIYRAGAVTSVKCEVVCENDVFRYKIDEMDRPEHDVDWFGDRGAVKGAYAYAEMVGGGTSKVVVVGPARIKRAMEASATARSNYSPWKTDYAAMVLKTAIHDLETFVPTSAEYRREQLRAVAEVAGQLPATSSPPVIQHATPVPRTDADGVIYEADIVADSVDAE
jgi:recombination protein RecT